MEREKGQEKILENLKLATEKPLIQPAAHDANSGKLVQSVLKTFVAEGYRMAQDTVKDRLAGIRHIFRV